MTKILGVIGGWSDGGAMGVEGLDPMIEAPDASA